MYGPYGGYSGPRDNEEPKKDETNVRYKYELPVRLNAQTRLVNAKQELLEQLERSYGDVEMRINSKLCDEIALLTEITTELA